MRARLPLLVSTMAFLTGCASPAPAPARADEVHVDDTLDVTLTTQAVGCQPYQEYQQMQTPSGEIVTGIDVCAEFQDACSCETSRETRRAVAVVTRDGDCLGWTLTETSFWSYTTGMVCPGDGTWSLNLDSYPDSTCALTIEPQMDAQGLRRMEIVCEWFTDDGAVKVTDRLLLQRKHSSG